VDARDVAQRHARRGRAHLPTAHADRRDVQRREEPRFGIAMSYARTSSTERADVLLLLASLGHLVSVLIGIAAEAAGLNLRYQANTVKARRVLSLAALGRLVAASDAVPLTRALLNAAWARVRSPLCPCPEP
jgi:hypothetical protein